MRDGARVDARGGASRGSEALLNALGAVRGPMAENSIAYVGANARLVILTLRMRSTR